MGGNRTAVTGANGVRSDYQFDALNRLIHLEHRRSDGTLLASYTYELDPAGNRTAMTETDGRREQYTYDDLYRLLEERVTDPVRGNHTIAYGYDPVSNRLTQTENGILTGYEYDDNDRLFTAGGTVFTYDSNGNTLSQTKNGQTTTYTYNAQSQLIGAQTPTSQLAYGYDADGIRISSIVNGELTNLPDRRQPAHIPHPFKAVSDHLIKFVLDNFFKP